MSNRTIITSASILAIGALLCVVAHGLLTRYEVSGATPGGYKLDKITGQAFYLFQSSQTEVR